MLRCWNCQEPGHVAADCLYARELARPVTGPARPFPMRDPDPPTPEYLEKRQQLGMPAAGPAVLAAACPWCKSGLWRRCVNIATGAETDPHYARQESAGVAQPSLRLAHIALRQVAESRAARGSV